MSIVREVEEGCGVSLQFKMAQSLVRDKLLFFSFEFNSYKALLNSVESALYK